MGSVSGTLADSARSYLKDRLYIILKGYLLWYWAVRVRRARRAGVSWFMEWLFSLYCTNIRTHIRTHIHSSTHTQKHTSHIASSWLQVPLGDFHPQTHTQTHTAGRSRSGVSNTRTQNRPCKDVQLESFGKCERRHSFSTFNCIFVTFIALSLLIKTSHMTIHAVPKITQCIYWIHFFCNSTHLFLTVWESCWQISYYSIYHLKKLRCTVEIALLFLFLGYLSDWLCC